jgi:hypothetical protein
MIEIIINMLKEVGTFAVIQITVIMIFFGSMRILYFRYPEFSTEREAFATLFAASLSNFNFKVFSQDESLVEFTEWYGYIILMVFLGISAITLVNFLIAIISNVYEKLSKISIGLYLRSIVNMRQTMQKDSRYSSLVSATPPFNAFIFLFVPFIMWSQSQKLNTVLLH